MQKNMEELLKEAYERYTLGTEFIEITPTARNVGKIRIVKPFKGYKHEELPLEYIWRDGHRIYINSGLSTEYKGNNFCSNPDIYRDGKWAPIIIKEPVFLIFN